MLPAIRYFSGSALACSLQRQVFAKLVHGTKLDKERPEYARGILYTEFQRSFENLSDRKKAEHNSFLVTMTDGSQASSRLLSMRGANCLLCLPKADPDCHQNNILSADTMVPVLLLGELEPTTYSEDEGPLHFPLCPSTWLSAPESRCMPWPPIQC